MKNRLRAIMLAGLALLVVAACQDDWVEPTGIAAEADAVLAKGGGHETTAGNNLSFPVIWSEGVGKALPGTPGAEPALAGEWWWWWETDATEEGYTACAPDPSDTGICVDGAAPGAAAHKAWLQKDAANTWQAGTYTPAGHAVDVDLIDWGDDLEAKDWTTRSMVRIETVLYQDLTVAPYSPMTEYVMRHVSGWGADEVWGLSTFNDAPETGPGTEATVFTPCARLTLQPLVTTRDNPGLDAQIYWDAETHRWTDLDATGLDYVDEVPVLNMAVHEAEDGPGYYNAEINVKGKIIFGYTLNARRADLDGGDYRLTFSLDQACGPDVTRSTSFTDQTRILLPVEEGEIVAADDGPDMGGGIAVIHPDENLTYMDIRLTASGGGGGGGPGGSRR